MKTMNYNTYTDFDRTLFLSITEQNDGRKVTFKYSGFSSEEQAKEFAEWWTDMWYFGYMGSTSRPLKDEDGNIYILAERYNSCD